MSDDIRTFIQSLPVKQVKETQVGDHIYLGYGRIRWGLSYVPVQIRIWLHENEIMASVKTKENGSVICPFNTLQEREEIVLKIKEYLTRSWN